jgi:hypothetical protein
MMNARIPITARLLEKAQKRYLVGLLELACEKLDITPTERAMAEERYTAVGQWLSDLNNPYLANASVYTQGSIRIGTTNRPIGRNEFDVDLMCHLPGAGNLAPQAVRDLVGNRLKSHGTYKNMLEPLRRGWRLVYANEFHMDITPSIDDPNHQRGGVLVPDRQLHDWKTSHPKGYANWFETIALREPHTLMEKREIRADVETMPGDIHFKGSLRRIVQIMKRHRDVWCAKRTVEERDNAPISIIITTLAARAYAHVISMGQYDNALDLLLDVVEAMPSFIEKRGNPIGTEKWVVNPMNEQENFADKWRTHPQREVAFYQWINAFKADLDRLAQEPGIDGVAKGLADLLDETISKAAITEANRRLNVNRANRNLVAATSGLILTTTSSNAYAVPGNTFFGE